MGSGTDGEDQEVGKRGEQIFSKGKTGKTKVEIGDP